MKIAPIVYPKQEDIIIIFKMFLFGSQKCKDVVLTDVYQLKAMMEVIRENVISLRLLRTVDINIHNIDANQLKIFSHKESSYSSRYFKEKVIYGVSGIVLKLKPAQLIFFIFGSLYRLWYVGCPS